MGSMPGPDRLHQLTARLRTPLPGAALAQLAHEIAPAQTDARDRIMALAWATHDLERSMAETPAPFVRCARDRVLDAHAAAVRYGPVLLLLEQPRTPEAGPLGAYLSRYGEGVAAIYLERPRFLPASGPTGHVPRPLYTPFGRRGWMLPHEWPWGPFTIALEEDQR